MTAGARQPKNKRAADREVNATRFRGLVRRAVVGRRFLDSKESSVERQSKIQAFGSPASGLRKCASCIGATMSRMR